MTLANQLKTDKNVARMRELCSVLSFCCVSLAIGFVPADGSATPIPITNPGFESNPAPVPSDITSGVPTGWDAYNPNSTPNVFFGSLYAAPDNYPGGAPQGNHVGVNFISANRPAGEEFGVFQTLSAALEHDTLYTLTVEVGNIASGFNDLNGTPNDASDDTFFSISGFNGYRVELRTDSVTGSGATLMSETVSVQDGNNIPDGEFRTVSLTFDSRNAQTNLIGESLEILLVNLNEIDSAFPSDDRETNFDDVRLSSSPVPVSTANVPIPWPNLLLLAAGLTGAGRGRLKQLSPEQSKQEQSKQEQFRAKRTPSEQTT